MEVKQTDTYISYLFHKEEEFSKIEYKVLLNHKEHGFLECYKVDYNGSFQLIYDISKYKPLKEIVSEVTSEEFYQWVIQLNQIKDIILNNGFMKPHRMEISLKDLYIDREKNRLYAIYLPIQLAAEEKKETLENRLRHFCGATIIQYKNFHNRGCIELKEDLEKKEISLEHIQKKIQSGIYQELSKLPIYITSSEEEKKKKLVFISVNIQEEVKLNITKTPFTIGKRVASVDGCIKKYPTISREHCKVVYKDSQHYLVDLNSSNGTYINGIRLKPFEEYPVNLGDQIRMAGIVFRLEEEE